MATVKEQITDENLLEVFNDIKGSECGNKPYANYRSFRAACIRYSPGCLAEVIQEKNQGPLNNMMEEHFRNICESFSPVIDQNENQPKSPRFAKGDEEDDILGDLGNNSMDEGVSAKPMQQTKVKKLKPRPIPHYLTGTAASRAMQRPKTPLAKTAVNQTKPSGGPQAIPSSVAKRNPKQPGFNKTVGQKTS